MRYQRGSAIVTGAFLRNFRHPVTMVRSYRMTTGCDLTTAYLEVNLPVDLIWGEKDEFYPDCTPLAKYLRVQPQMLPVNHDWPITQPRLAAQVIREIMTAQVALQVH